MSTPVLYLKRNWGNWYEDVSLQISSSLQWHGAFHCSLVFLAYLNCLSSLINIYVAPISVERVHSTQKTKYLLPAGIKTDLSLIHWQRFSGSPEQSTQVAFPESSSNTVRWCRKDSYVWHNRRWGNSTGWEIILILSSVELPTQSYNFQPLVVIQRFFSSLFMWVVLDSPPQIHNFFSFWFFLQSTPVFRTLTIGLLWALWTWIYMLSLSWALDIALSLNPYPSLSVNVLSVPIPCQLVILIQSLFFKLSTFDLKLFKYSVYDNHMH